jgi:hypothetical protein
MILQIDEDCVRVQIFTCDECDGIHFAAYDEDDCFVKQIVLPRGSLDTVIAELIKLRDDPKGN